MIPSGRKPDHFSVDFRAQMGIMDGIEAKECRRGPLRDARGEIERVFTLSSFFVVKTMVVKTSENDGILLFVVKTMGFYFGLKVDFLS